MKQFFIFILCFSVLSSCESVADQLMNTGKIESFDYMVGNWKRTNDETPQQTYETWQKANDSLYVGHGFTMVEKDTVWQEFIELVHENHRWNFKVIGQNDSVVTVFELGLRDSTSFTSYNLRNDFPSHIKYERKGDSLNALIWGDSLEIPFNFIKKN